MPWIILVAVVLWFVVGNPQKNLADWFWSNAAAPWEQVDAFYYPSRFDLTVYDTRRDVGGIEECRDWAFAQSATYGDPSLTRGDYECGIGPLKSTGAMIVYRRTSR